MEQARRLDLSKTRWDMIISTRSCGILVIGDGRAVDASEVLRENNRAVLALVRYQTWLTRSSLAVAVLTKWDR